jgi:ABC-type multidrug transport system ATPase subunit
MGFLYFCEFFDLFYFQDDMSRLHADSIIKYYGDLRVLSDVFIHCEQGEIVAIMGRNGCGKSTLMKIIFGSLTADNKFVRVGSKLIKNVSDSYGLISYLPQDHFLPGHISIKKIISLFCNGYDHDALLANPLVNPFLSQKSKLLSDGELRLIEILLILHSPSQYLLLDEPFNGLSPRFIDIVKELISQKKDKGIIMTDHDYRNVMDIADRIVLISNGSARQIKDLNELRLYGYLPFAEI